MSAFEVGDSSRLGMQHNSDARNNGNQPYTTSGLAITRTLSVTSPPVFNSFEHYLFGPVACFNRL